MVDKTTKAASKATSKAASKDAHDPKAGSHSDKSEDDETTSTYQKDTHSHK